MNTNTKYIGIDIAKAKLDVDLPKPHERFANTAAGIAGLMAALPTGSHLVVEASGGYEKPLLEAAWAAGRPISQVPPERVLAYARSQGQRAKTDPIDAAKLSAYGEALRPRPTTAPDPTRAKTRELLRAREHVLELQRSEANHHEHLGEGKGLVRRLHEARVRQLAKQLEELEAEIRRVVHADPKAGEAVARLCQIKGVGEITAWTCWADMPELGQLEPGQAAALSGLAPYARDSGQKQGQRHIGGGRARVRRVAYMAALTASRWNHVLRQRYQRLVAAGKPHNVAIIALARSLIELMNRLLKDPGFELQPSPKTSSRAPAP